MSSSENFSLVRRISQFGTYLHTWLRGKEVGRDSFGNRYFIDRGKPRAAYGGKVRQKRWVIYSGEPEPTKIPPEWHIWLHYTADAPLPESSRRDYQLPHHANATGTSDAYLPDSLKGEARSMAAGEYQAWKPE